MSRADRGDEVVARAVEQLVRERDAGRHGLHDLAPYDSFRDAWILDLLADRDAIAVLHEPSQIFLAGPHRHPRERDFRRPPVVARRERQAEDARRRLGVVVEHLVEVAHPEEQDRALMSRLDLPVLLHQRRRDGTTHGRFAPAALGSSVTKPMIPRCLSAATSAAAACRVG